MLRHLVKSWRILLKNFMFVKKTKYILLIGMFVSRHEVELANTDDNSIETFISIRMKFVKIKALFFVRICSSEISHKTLN